MASQPPSGQKSSSRWGSFLANVESRLDTILADEDTAAKQQTVKGDGKVQEQPVKPEGMSVSAGANSTQSRTSSTNRAQDRLNERLAKAMANRNLGKKADTPAASSGVPSGTASPANGAETPRDSTEILRDGKSQEEHVQQELDEPPLEAIPKINNENMGQVRDESAGAAQSQDADVESDAMKRPTFILKAPDTPSVGRTSLDSKGSGSARTSMEGARPINSYIPDSPKINGLDSSEIQKSPHEYEATIIQLRSDYEAAELRRQEETHNYLERIDAMQAKLQYLTKEATEIAKNAAAEAETGSPEQRLAEKDQRIALLIDEGQKLSQTELKHMSIIKKLRAKAGEDEKSLTEVKKSAEKQQRLMKEAQERARRADTAEKQSLERLKGFNRTEKDLESVRAQKDASEQLVRDLQMQLSDVTSSAREAEEQARAEALEQERRKAAELSDELSNLKIEKELADKEHQNEVRELREKSEREKERARVAEIERQAEQDTLESRLEAYRARAEEASAGQGGDVQAKLLRQTETLQNQYAVASENWQGIEGSLLSRITVLEKERDEINKRESDIRRKARETNTKCRRAEDELERANVKINDLESEVSSRAATSTQLSDRLAEAEKEVAAMRNDLKAEREAWEIQMNNRVEEEKSKIRESMVRGAPDFAYHQNRIDSPVLRTRKSSNADRVSPARSRRPQGPQALQGLGIVSSGHSPMDRSLSRQSSEKRVVSANFDSSTPVMPMRTDSMNTVPNLSLNNGIPPTPSIHDSKDEDGDFDDLATPATPDRTVNDVISASTAGAGPSVQLVERMSAAVRRLESEKAAHKDELNRLTSQRDESREQVVELMRDNEGKRASDERVRNLEKELGKVNERHLTTLEMLGEKSERVEELKADVDDLKGMYRELVERTTR